MSALMRFPGFRYRALTLSYDDGVAHDKRLIEILNRHGIKATFNVCSSFLGTPGHLTREDLETEVLANGHEVAVHGERHLFLSLTDGGVGLRDILRDRENLEGMLHRIIQGMAYANGFGSTSDSTVEALRTIGIHYARTTNATERFDIPTDWLRMPPTCHHTNPRLMELAKAFIETPLPDYYWAQRPRLFYLWGHSYEFANADNWNVIEDFASYMGDRKDVWYATNGEIYDYVEAYRSLQYSVDGTLIHNPSVLPVDVCDFGKEIRIHPGETVDTKKQ